MSKIYLLSNDSSEIDKILTGLELTHSFDVFKEVNEFISNLSTKVPELLILDHDFSQISIVQLIEKLKEKEAFKNIPIIILTSPEKRSEIIQCIKLGVKDFLVKPYLVNVLSQKIKSLTSSSDLTKMKVAGTGSLNVVAEEKRKKMILAELDNLPAFPLIVQKVMQIVNDRDSSASDFQDVVNKDQTLTGKILKMANSPFYSNTREIVLIKDAVVTLGYKTVKSIAYAASTGEIFKKNLPQYGLAIGGLWKHSLGCAIAARTIGKELKLADEINEELFVCGLLHDIGKLILGKFISRDDQIYMAPETGPDNILNLEKKFTGFNHSQLGTMIAEKWSLPNIINEAIKFHHTPDESSLHTREVTVVNLANYICNLNKIGFSKKNECSPNLLDCVKRNLDINDLFINKLVDIVKENLNEIDKIAGI
jgi:putative nucleotidyltransferase with HDIG domain